MQKELLTIPEVAHHLCVDPTTVRRWISLGSLPAIILPRCGPRKVYRIHRSILDAILLPSTQDGNPPDPS